jgi:hypothetical protein
MYPVHACPYSLETCLKLENYHDVGMPRGRLKIGFLGNRGIPEQIFMISFRDGENVRHFVLRGVC